MPAPALHEIRCPGWDDRRARVCGRLIGEASVPMRPTPRADATVVRLQCGACGTRTRFAPAAAEREAA